MNPPDPRTARRFGGALHPRRLRSFVRGPREHRQPIAAPRPNFTATLRTWHRRAGVFAFLFMGWLGASGLLLNEASSLNLNARTVSWSWLMSLYGLQAAPPASGFGADGHWLAVAAGQAALDGKILQPSIRQPLGLVATPDPAAQPGAGRSAGAVLYVALSDSVVLLGGDGRRIDELRSPPLPISAIRRIGRVRGTPATIAIQGSDTAYASADEGETWAPVAATEVQWSSRQMLPPAIQAALVPLSEPSVSVQQLLVDAHSGRLFGRFGSLFVDVVGVAAVLLAVSGVWMTWRTRKARRRPVATLAPAPRVASEPNQS